MNAYADRTAGSLYAARLLRDTAAGGSQRPSSLCPMRAVKLNAFAVLKLASACHVSQNISSKLWGAHLPPLPVRQKPLFTHEVLFQRFPCVRSPLSRTKPTFTASRASKPPFHARIAARTALPEKNHLAKARPPNHNPPPLAKRPLPLPRKTSSSTKRNIKSRPEGRLQS